MWCCVLCVHVVCGVCTCGVWCWWCVCTCGVVWCVYMWCCVVCVHVVLCVVCTCGVCVCVVCTCGVFCWWCVWCVVKLGTRKTPRVYVQNASVCTVRTSPCVPATSPHVQDMRACCRYTRRRPDRTHGGVLNVHTGEVSLLSLLLSLSLSVALSLVLSFVFSSLVLSLFLHVSFSFFLLFSLFSFLLSSPLSSSLSLSFTAHTETRSDRQVTLPTKNGHAPRDPVNQERAINLSILAMSQPGKFSRVESN